MFGLSHDWPRKPAPPSRSSKRSLEIDNVHTQARPGRRRFLTQPGENQPPKCWIWRKKLNPIVEAAFIFSESPHYTGARLRPRGQIADLDFLLGAQSTVQNDLCPVTVDRLRFCLIYKSHSPSVRSRYADWYLDIDTLTAACGFSFHAAPSYRICGVFSTAP